MRRDESGHIVSIPNSISLGPFNGRIIYPGQANRCFICQALDHQARDCPTFKCWKCGELGHKAKECQNDSANRCFICQALDHQARDCTTFKCWKCGELGHRAKECQKDSECSLCGLKGHTFFKCPKSFANITKAPQQPSTSAPSTQ
uniref:CCHC-type domain-containing protein n=1 Tax=Oreochromis niloticus TaxID=8128 RepID=A0A669C6S9_ORENI